MLRIRFVFSLAQHMIVDLTRATHAFAGPSNLAGAPALYYGNITTTLNFTKSVTYVAVTLISDALIVSTYLTNFLGYLLLVIGCSLQLAHTDTITLFRRYTARSWCGSDVGSSR